MSDNNKEVTLKVDEKMAALFREKGFVAERMLSKGAYGQVFRGTDLKTNKPVALKVVFLDKVSDKIRAKFLPREIVALMQVSHPHIVYVLDIMRADQKLFFILEFANGGDLTRFIKANGPIPERQTAIWFAQVC